MSKTFVLIHGSWHGDWAWQAVIRHLEARGHHAYAPTLAGHGPEAERVGITHRDCVDSVVSYIRQQDLKAFYSLNIPKSFIYCRQDMTLPPGSFYPQMSSRLGTYKLVEMDGGHEVLFTHPAQLADKLVEASSE